MPQLVPEDDLAAANSLRGLVDDGAVIVGPAVGAVLVAVGGVSASFAMTGLTFLCSAAPLSRVRTRSRPVDVTEGGAAGLLKQVRVGFGAIASSATARVLVAFSVVASFIYGTDTVLFVLVSSQRLGTGANGFGYLMAGLGVGGILASVVVPRLAARSRLAWVIVTGLLVFCLPTLAMIVVRQPAVGFGVQVVRGAGTLVVDVLAVTAMQRSLPDDLLARVFGAFFSLVIAAIAAGSLLTPLLVHALGLDGALVVTGAVVPAVALAGLPALHRMDRENAAELHRLADVIAVLEGTSLLDGAQRVHLERMAASARRVDVAAGAVVIRQGDPADALFVLLQSRCSVSIAPDGTQTESQQRTIPDLMPGDVFGEIGLLRQSARTATVTAAEPTHLLSIGADAFLTAVSQTGVHPTLQEATRLRLARVPATVLHG